MGRKASETITEVVTMKIDKAIIDKIRALAYWDRKTIRDLSEGAFSEYIAKYEKKHGEIKPVPNK